MKTVKITCDNCQAEIGEDDCIRIGSKSGDALEYKNSLKSNDNIYLLSHYGDLHFCSKEHFIEYFFPPKPKPIVTKPYVYVSTDIDGLIEQFE